MKILVVFLLVSSSILAQTAKMQELQPATVKGIVIDAATGEPIPGASVYIKETMKGGISGMDGTFVLPGIKKGQTVCVSCIGNEDLKIKFTGQEYIKASLIQDVISLNEIVTIGYGTQERRDLTGAVATIDSKTIGDIAPSFDNALVGKVAGVNISLSNGAPGSATSITIRGISSLNADSNPLIVIDGMPVYSSGKGVNNVNFGNGTVKAAGLGGNSVSNGFSQVPEFERNPLSALNPDDIESIEILKDAFSTAIYGSRGAAGVILVTTKKGKKGAPKIKVNQSVKFGQPIETPSLLNANQFSQVYTKFNKSINSAANFPTDYNTDWLDAVLRTSVTKETNVSLQGGTEKAKYYISFNSFNQEGYIINQDFSRNSFRTNFSFAPVKWINFGVNSSLAFINNEALNSQIVYRDAVLRSPNIPIYDADGNYFFHTAGTNSDSNINNISGNLSNPVAKANEENHIKDVRNISSLFLEVKPTSWLHFKSDFGIDFYTSKAYGRNFETPSLIGGTATLGSNQNIKYVFNNVLTLKKIYRKHFVNATFGQSFETSSESSLRLAAKGFFDDSEKSITSASTSNVLESITQQWAVISYFTRLNYRYNDRYLAGFTYRVDGSSRFSKNQRYRGFPSFSAGWIVTEELFMDDYKHIINNLKIRTSYGLTGLDGSFGGYYGNQGQWTQGTRERSNSSIKYNGVPLLYNQQTANPNLEWETTTSFDLGFDASFLKGKFDVTFDYFYKKTNNLLASDHVPLYMGWSSQPQNVGSLQNEGLELVLSSQIIKRRNIDWNISFNVSRITNKLLSLNEAGYQMAQNQSAETKVYIVGQDLNQFYLYDWAGVNPLTGNPQWRYQDGTLKETPPQGNIDQADPLGNRYASGSSMPDFYGGLNNTFRYKNFDLSMNLAFSVGQKMYNGTQATLMTYTLTSSNNLSTDILDHWKILGHNTDVPKLDNSTTLYAPAGNNSAGLSGYDVSRLSNRFLEDASYLRLKDITLSYNIKGEWTRKLAISNLRVYVQGSNLLTWTNYTGVDPEVNAYGSSAVLGGYDEITLPQAKSIKFGLGVTF